METCARVGAVKVRKDDQGLDVFWRRCWENMLMDLMVEKAMAPHSSTFAWKIPWMEEPGGLQSMGSLRVGHDWATSLSLFHFHALDKEMATHSSVLAWRIPGAGEPGGLMSRVTQSRSRLKWLSSSSENQVLFFNKGILGTSLGSSGWESACQCRGYRFDPWSGMIPYGA